MPARQRARVQEHPKEGVTPQLSLPAFCFLMHFVNKDLGWGVTNSKVPRSQEVGFQQVVSAPTDQIDDKKEWQGL